MDGKFILTFLEIKEWLSYNAKTTGLVEEIEQRKSRINLYVRSSGYDFTKVEERLGVKFLASLSPERYEVLCQAVDKMYYFIKVDNYLSENKLDVEQVVWKTSPFKMLYIRTKDSDMYFTADSLIEVKNGKQTTKLIK